MALLIGIEELLNKQRVESARVEFKEGWNPSAIYRSVCAFANDLDNLGGGYILIGVEEENGIAKRPVKGIEEGQLDKIQKAIVGLNNQIHPFYAPKISVEQVDGRWIMVLWVPTGTERPYQVPEDIIAKQKTYKPFIRYGTSSIEAKGDLLDDVNDLKDRTPFDERGNASIKTGDISMTLVRDHLATVGSRLAETMLSQPMDVTLEQMNLMTGPKECRMIKNVAAMMFAEHLDTFFPMSRVEIVLFPKGRVENPELFVETPKIVGNVPQMIKKALDFIKTNILRETVTKPKNQAESKRVWNYPYQAIEEAVVNALYHRDYKVNEPVEIAIEPTRISILSYSGPDRSITMDAIQQAKILRSRRYRNRNLGEYLKELNLTEGRATGIPTIQKELQKNGSAPAVIETDNDRSYFLIDIPCHPEAQGLWEREMTHLSIEKDLQKDLQKKNIKLSDKMFRVLLSFAQNPSFTQQQIAVDAEVDYSYIIYCVSVLRKKGILSRKGGKKYGTWIILWSDEND